MTHSDTIVALSSTIQSAMRAIVRMSGERAFDVIDKLIVGGSNGLQPGRFARSAIAIERGIEFDVTIYPFRSPRSSTGEDVIELHIPASPYLVTATLKRLVEQGARLAQPGEFTARAFFNGKLDLTAAEGVAATISASNRAELDAARQLLGGELSRRLTPLLDELVATLALIEVGIDFTEEDVSFISRSDLEQRLGNVRDQLHALVKESPRLERLSHEPRIILIGRPNAGKSTLLNVLAGKMRAVVSDVAGTTRDALSARIALRRGFVTLVDVAGIEASGGDLISTQMQRAAATQLATADAILLLIDSSDSQPRVELPREPELVVYTKIDLAAPPVGKIGIDATHGEGLELLRHKLDDIAFGAERGTTRSLAINARHVSSIELACESIGHAIAGASAGSEIVASELRLAIDQLGTVIGSVSPDDVLGKIFSGFCIGK